MTFLDSREKAIEAAFQHDQEMTLRIRTRRNRLLGLWIAELTGLSGAAADAYAGNLVAAGIGQQQDTAITRKVQNDLAAHRVRLSAHRLGRKMVALERLARQHVMDEVGPVAKG